MNLPRPVSTAHAGGPGTRSPRRVWRARLLLVAMMATTMVAAPSFTTGASAAPASSGVVELADLPVVDRAEGTVQRDVPHAGARALSLPDEPTGVEPETVEWAELAPVDAGDIVMVGLVVDGEVQPAAEVRTQTDGEWIEWTPLAWTHEEDGPDRGTAEARRASNATDPVWLGEVERVQVRVEETAADLEELQLHTVEVDGSTEYDPLARASGAAEASTGAPNFISRSQWDPNNDCRPRKAASTADRATMAVIHHTATSNSYSQAQAATQLRSMCLYHRNSNGWSDLGYNIVVDRYGRTYEGRAGGLDRAVIGAHAAGYNTGSVGVSVMGDFQNANIPSAAVAAVDRAVAWKFAIHGIDPTGWSSQHGQRSIIGHRDVGSTSCPGQYFVPHVRSMGERIAPTVSELRAQLHNWDEGQVGDFRNGEGEGIVTYNAGTGNTMMADPNGGYFDYSPWATFSTRDGWTERLVADFTGDGRDDVAHFHPDSGRWWVNRSDGEQFSPELWSTFKTTRGWYTHVTGDFDGDGREDIASYHRNGSWWVSTSDGDGFEVTQWGEYRTSEGWQSHLVGNFTGDGRDEILSYHPGAGRWYLLEAGTTGLLFRETSFEYRKYGEFRTRTGWSHQLAGDFDGDGRTDVANYHPGNGTWWIGTSGPRSLAFTLWAQFTTRLGWQTHLVGDVTGEGRDDLVSYHPRSGNFWVSESTGEDFAGDRWMQYGLNTGWDHHVLLDVDDDGRKDVASFHRQYEDWWVMRSNGSSPFNTPRRNQW